MSDTVHCDGQHWPPLCLHVAHCAAGLQHEVWTLADRTHAGCSMSLLPLHCALPAVPSWQQTNCSCSCNMMAAARSAPHQTAGTAPPSRSSNGLRTDAANGELCRLAFRVVWSSVLRILPGLRRGSAAARLLDCRFESRRGHECLSLASVLCCQVEVTVSGWSLVQRSPTDCVWHWVYSVAAVSYTCREMVQEVRIRKLHISSDTSFCNEIYTVLGYYAASCGNCLPTFRDNVSVPFSRVKSPRRKTSVNNYHTTPRNIPEECRSHQHCGGSLTARIERAVHSSIQRSFETLFTLINI
jgi:hypothetical protein